MATTIDQIKTQAAILSNAEKAELAHFLLESIEPEEEGVEEAWSAEIVRRLEEVRNGTAVGIPAEEVFAEMRKRLS